MSDSNVRAAREALCQRIADEMSAAERALPALEARVERLVSAVERGDAERDACLRAALVVEAEVLDWQRAAMALRAELLQLLPSDFLKLTERIDDVQALLLEVHEGCIEVGAILFRDQMPPRSEWDPFYRLGRAAD